MVNKKDKINIDYWLLLHLIIPFILALWLIPQGWDYSILVLIVIGWELLEHLYIGKALFGWSDKNHENTPNAIIDILVGVFGVIVANWILSL